MIEIIEPVKEKEPGTVGVRVRVEGYDPCPIHKPSPCNCPKKCTGIIEKGDITLLQFAKICLLNIFPSGGYTDSVTDTSSDPHTVSANTASGTVQIRAGTGTTLAAFSDHKLQTPVDSAATATMSSVVSSSTSGYYTITASVSAGADRNYTEMGLQVTIGGNVYLLCHDVLPAAVPVLNGGTALVVYKIMYG